MTAPQAARSTAAEEAEADRHDQEQQLTLAAVRDVQAGRVERFAFIYRCNYDRVFALARLMLRDRHEAEDISQEAFTRALRSLHTYRPQEGVAFSAWLLRITRNCALRRIEGRKRTSVFEPTHMADVLEPVLPPPPPAGEAHEGAWVDDDVLASALEQLPMAQRQVLALRFAYDLNVRETALVLERTEPAVRQLQMRALRTLRQRLERANALPASAPRLEGDDDLVSVFPRGGRYRTAHRWVGLLEAS